MLADSSDILIFTENKEHHIIYSDGLSRGDTYIQFAHKDETGFTKMGNHDFDLIIVEINHPMISEISFIERIYSLNPNVPIVIVSEYFNETKNIVFGNKVSEYISKPLTVEKLHNSVREILFDSEQKSNESINGIDDSKKLSILFEMSKCLNSITDFNTLLNTIIKLVTEALECDRATLFVLDKSKNELWSKVGTGLKVSEIRFPLSEGIAGEVAVSGKSILTDNPYIHPKFNKEFDRKTGYKTSSLLCVPMKNLKGEIVGVFQVLNKRSERFSREDEIFLSAIGATTAIALENILFYEEKKKEMSDIKKLYDELYTAQNMIEWEAKHSIISELRGFIQQLKKYDAVPSSIDKLKNTKELDLNSSSILDKINLAHQKLYSRLGQYMNDLMNNLKSEDRFQPE